MPEARQKARGKLRVGGRVGFYLLFYFCFYMVAYSIIAYQRRLQVASKQHVNIEVNDNENALVDGEKIASVMQIIETWEYPELLRLRDLISEAYKQKAEEAKATVIAETQRKFEQLGLSFDDVVAMQKKRKRAVRTPVVPKYRSPEGREWSGKGARPKWIREYEEAGGNREDYRIQEEGEAEI
jgi:DNA-binding protein H-NS